MSVGTSDSTVISPITTEAHNLNTTIASAALRDGSPSANTHDNTAENCQLDGPPPHSLLNRVQTFTNMSLRSGTKEVVMRLSTHETPRLSPCK